jgi:membrane-associated protein
MFISLDQVYPFLIHYKYLALLIGATIEGPVLMAAAGFLTKLGYFNPALALLALLIGDLISDVLWYYLGYFKWYTKIAAISKKLNITQRVTQKITTLYNAYPNRVIFFSKISMGFGFNLVVLITAGILRIPIKKFVIINFFGGIFWVGMFLSLGYFFGNIYLLIDQGLRTLFMIIGFATLFATLFLLGKFIRIQFLKRNTL